MSAASSCRGHVAGELVNRYVAAVGGGEHLLHEPVWRFALGELLAPDERVETRRCPSYLNAGPRERAEN